MIKYQKDDFSKELLNKIKEMRIPQYISIKSLIIRSLISLSWVLLPYIIILNQSNFGIVSVMLSIWVGIGLAFISYQFHIVNHFETKGRVLITKKYFNHIIYPFKEPPYI